VDEDENSKTIDDKYTSIFEDPKNFMNWDGASIGNKAKDVRDIGNLALVISYLGVSFGNVKLLSIAFIMSGLFSIFKKFNYINTSYGPF
jgi:hypothetical protein